MEQRESDPQVDRIMFVSHLDQQGRQSSLILWSVEIHLLLARRRKQTLDQICK